MECSCISSMSSSSTCTKRTAGTANSLTHRARSRAASMRGQNQHLGMKSDNSSRQIQLMILSPPRSRCSRRTPSCRRCACRDRYHFHVHSLRPLSLPMASCSRMCSCDCDRSKLHHDGWYARSIYRFDGFDKERPCVRIDASHDHLRDVHTTPKKMPAAAHGREGGTNKKESGKQTISWRPICFLLGASRLVSFSTSPRLRFLSPPR